MASLLQMLFGLSSPQIIKKSGSNSNGNPFPEHRTRILGLESRLGAVGGAGDQEEFVKSVRSFVAELTRYNSNVSRLIVASVKALFPADSPHQISIKDLFLLHNRKCVEIRKTCIHIIETSPMLQAEGRIDDFAMLNDSQNEQLYGVCLNRIGIQVQYLEDVWAKLMFYEEMVFKSSEGKNI